VAPATAATAESPPTISAAAAISQAATATAPCRRPASASSPTTRPTDLDFDIEQGATSSNAAINAMRATALAQVQAQEQIRVAFTLPVNADGR
jgi:hypothetical protein